LTQKKERGQRGGKREIYGTLPAALCYPGKGMWWGELEDVCWLSHGASAFSLLHHQYFTSLFLG